MEVNNIQIREMKLDDYNEIDRLMSQVHQIHVDGRPDLYVDVDHVYSYDLFKEMVKNQDMITILAENNKEEKPHVCGICIVSMRSKTCMVKRRTAYMEDLCVDETYQKLGIGKKLYLYAKEKAKEMGAERLDLMVWGFNEKALDFYKHMGMKIQRYIMEEEL